MADGGAFDGAADEPEGGSAPEVAAVEAIFPLAQVARQVFGADTVMRAALPVGPRIGPADPKREPFPSCVDQTSYVRMIL